MGNISQIWLQPDSLQRITEKSFQCKLHILRSVPGMHFQLNHLNFSVIEEKNLNSKAERDRFNRRRE